ncbi:Putative RxLR effector [Phytophthora palmivora]|uniref:RxLR effector n=1 Tax=Phytophthora palmivora TaxID=4796 RepID=A0A2P4YR02_9STRA|nr:Putative RxLR effector [Phytophthora palmivora]
MHIYYLVGFVCLVSIVLINADTSMADVTGTQSNRVGIHSSTVKNNSVTRLLSTMSVRAQEDTEERVNPSVSALEKLKIMLTPSKLTPDQLKKKLTR